MHFSLLVHRRGLGENPMNILSRFQAQTVTGSVSYEINSTNTLNALCR